jgi:hypothetical protein
MKPVLLPVSTSASETTTKGRRLSRRNVVLFPASGGLLSRQNSKRDSGGDDGTFPIPLPTASDVEGPSQQ